MTDREVLISVFEAAVKRVDPDSIIQNTLTPVDAEGRLDIKTEQERLELDLSVFSRIVVVGAGKATARMAKGVESVLGSRIDRGVIAVKPGHTEDLSIVKMVEAGHPVPNDGSIKAAEEIVSLLDEADERTLVINLISGGGSALLTLPVSDTISLEDMQRTTSALLECGAAIQEINCIRKHLSGIKGGRLAERAAPATVLSLILSDVIGDDLSSIASGLTAPDPTSFRDALGIIIRYGIEKKIPVSVLSYVRDGIDGRNADTPKAAHEVFNRVHNVLIGSNAQALIAAAQRAGDLGLNSVILTSQLSGEASEVAKLFSGIAGDMVRLPNRFFLDTELPTCIISGGETTVTIRGTGSGGRNQEMALSFLREVMNDRDTLERITFLSGGTDGNDGPTDAAGGIIDGTSGDMMREKGIDIHDFLARNDSYHALQAMKSLLVTGPTNTNVCDIQLLLVR